VDVPDGQHRRRRGEVGTRIEYGLGPTPIGGTKESERAVRHFLLLAREIAGHQIAAEMSAHPLVIGLIGGAN
jgi:hypothetical protein